MSISQEWLVVESYGDPHLHFLQGDEGKPGKIGSLGRQGSKVQDTICVIVDLHSSCFHSAQGPPGDPGETGDPGQDGDRVRVMAACML